jgi:hypothetical protein
MRLAMALVHANPRNLIKILTLAENTAALLAHEKLNLWLV